MYTGRELIEFLNKIQKTAYRLNPFIVGVAEYCNDKGLRIAEPKFIPTSSTEELPPVPPDIDTNEARKAYKQAAKVIHDRNNELVKKSCRTRMTMAAVDKFKDVDRFYIPWSFDYRGRVYPIPSYLTPQDTDFGKSLLTYADSAYMTPASEEWLAFQVATTYGLDKKPIQERLDWVHANTTLISKIAYDPLVVFLIGKQLMNHGNS